MGLCELNVKVFCARGAGSIFGCLSLFWNRSLEEEGEGRGQWTPGETRTGRVAGVEGGAGKGWESPSQGAWGVTGGQSRSTQTSQLHTCNSFSTLRCWGRKMVLPCSPLPCPGGLDWLVWSGVWPGVYNTQSSSNINMLMKGDQRSKNKCWELTGEKQSKAEKCKYAAGQWRVTFWTVHAGLVSPSPEAERMQVMGTWEMKNVGWVLHSLAWKRGEWRQKLKMSLKSWGAKAKLLASTATKSRRHRKKLAVLAWTVFPVLNNQNFLVSRNLVLITSPFQVFRGLKYVTLNIAYQRQP